MRAQTLGQLTTSGYTVVSVKDEMRNNLIRKLRQKEKLFPGIIGFDETVIPSLVNAILAKHDIMLLGLRGQAKSRLVRQLPSLLDEYIPVIKGCEINDNPFHPVCKRCVDLTNDHGDAVEIDWLHRDARLGEKLATPDVTIADLIGDIDPIKAASQRLHYSHEGVIHFGIIPRTNRGIFAINELPDLQPRIQVGLFNILEEKDIQIRGFSIRIPLDIILVFTANPEDYTNRGNIITPLKDRIDSQILTHYPRTIEEAISITEQEASVQRDGREIHIPHFFKQIIEQIAFEARKSEYVDQKSGVSARLTISAMENLISNAERRAIINHEEVIVPRICDLQHVLPAMTGKVELVFEGEQEGSAKVSKALIGKAVREIFKQYFPDPLARKPVRGQTPEQKNRMEDSEYTPIIRWFESGNNIQIADDMKFDVYANELSKVRGLRETTLKFMKAVEMNKHLLASSMEFLLDGLHQFSKIAKDEVDNQTLYKDMVGSIFPPRGVFEEED
ncbi:MAG: magnesium chelatase [Ignavibacteriae bacterium]|nr:magnesium chelatase [Ignavibacteriota bacterium]